MARSSTAFTDLDFDRPGKQTGYINIPHSPHEDAWGATRIPLCVFGAADHFGHLRHQFDHVGEVRGGKHVIRRRAQCADMGPHLLEPFGIVLGRQRQPVSELRQLIHNEIGIKRQVVTNPGGHAVVIFLDDVPVSVHPVHLPGENDARIRPSGGSDNRIHFAVPDVRRDIRIAAGRQLPVANVLKPFAKKSILSIWVNGHSIRRNIFCRRSKRRRKKRPATIAAARITS